MEFIWIALIIWTMFRSGIEIISNILSIIEDMKHSSLGEIIDDIELIPVLDSVVPFILAVKLLTVLH